MVIEISYVMLVDWFYTENVNDGTWSRLPPYIMLRQCPGQSDDNLACEIERAFERVREYQKST